MFGKIKELEDECKSLRNFCLGNERRTTAVYEDLERLTNQQLEKIHDLEDTNRKLSKKIDLLCSNPAKYKIGDTVWYGENKFEVVDVKICNDYIRYMYDLERDSVYKIPYAEYSIEEEALYTKKK